MRWARLGAGAVHRQRAARSRAEASAAIAQAVNCAARLLDIKGVHADSFARELQAALINESAAALAQYN